MLAKIFLAIFTLVLAIFLGEIFLRFINQPPDLDRSFKVVGEEWSRPETKLNTDGFRDRRYDHTRPDDTVRFYALGDSFTFGLYIDDPSVTYPKLLEKKLPSLFKKKVEVINASYPGFNIVDMRQRFESEGVSYHPNFVTVGINYDEVNLDEKFFFDENNTVSQWIRKSRWYQITVGNYLRRKSENKYRDYILGTYTDKNSSDWQRFSSELLSLNSEVKKSGAILILVIFPQIYSRDPNRTYDFHAYNKRYAEFGKEHGIIIIDSVEKVLSHKDRSELVVNPSDSHPTPLMHGIMADTIYQYIMKHQEQFTITEE